MAHSPCGAAAAVLYGQYIPVWIDEGMERGVPFLVSLVGETASCHRRWPHQNSRRYCILVGKVCTVGRHLFSRWARLTLACRPWAAALCLLCAHDPYIRARGRCGQGRPPRGRRATPPATGGVVSVAQRCRPRRRGGGNVAAGPPARAPPTAARHCRTPPARTICIGL